MSIAVTDFNSFNLSIKFSTFFLFFPQSTNWLPVHSLFIVTWVGYSFNESGDVIKLIKEEIGRSHTRQITYYLLNNKIVKIYYELQYGISRNNGGMIYFDNNKIIKNGAWGEPTNAYALLRQGYKLLKRKPETITNL